MIEQAGSKIQSSRGCPVQSSSDKDTGNGSNATGLPGEADSSAAAEGRGVWSGLASWIPFRGAGSGRNADQSVSRAATAASGAQGAVGVKKGVGGGGGCPVENRSESSSAASSGCPIQHDSASEQGQGLTGVTASAAAAAAAAAGGTGKGSGKSGGTGAAFNALNNEYVYGQDVSPGQEIPLSTSRQRSTILKADFNPDHQPQAAEEKTWVYPSEQQYYNAIKRKGYKASAVDMPSTLAIHNAVNEKGWEMVKEWESARASGAGDDIEGASRGVVVPKLLRFTGRPQDTSPKAWVKSNLLGYRPPFDRHDWVVKRPDGTEARYVIDFYAGKAPPGSNVPVAMHLDVRPALDNFDAVVDRTRMFYSKEVRPYLSGVLDAFKNDPGPSPESGKEDAPPPPPAGR